MPRCFALLLAGVACLLAAPQPAAALQIVFDYTYDHQGFFAGGNLARRNVLEAAADVFEARLAQQSLPAVALTTPNHLALRYAHPQTGVALNLNGDNLPADILRIYVGARDLPGTTASEASFDFQFTGQVSVGTALLSRFDYTTHLPFGGSMSFDTSANWYFDTNTATTETFTGQLDFYSYAQREIARVLGFSTGMWSYAFKHDMSEGYFIGTEASSLYGSNIPMLASGQWAAQFSYAGEVSLMGAELLPGQRGRFTELDFAVLKDMGYQVSAVPEPGAAGLMLMGLLPALSRRRVRIARR